MNIKYKNKNIIDIDLLIEVVVIFVFIVACYVQLQTTLINSKHGIHL